MRRPLQRIQERRPIADFVARGFGVADSLWSLGPGVNVMMGESRVGQEALFYEFSQVPMHFLAEPALRANAEAIADEQHPDHQLRVDRRTPDLAVEGPQVSAHAGQVDEPIEDR